MIRLRVQTKTPVRIFLLSGSLLVGSILVLPNETSLRPEQEEYLRLVAAPEVSGRVFSGFNDGGWLALALELSAKTGKVFSLIDGRTLVMGEERLKEYADFVSEKTKDCDQLRQWQADTVIVRTGSKITNRLEGACRENWRRLKSGQYWNVFQAERPGEFATPQAVRP